MTGRAARQDVRAANVVLMFELRTGFELVRRRLPGHVVNFGSRPENLLGRAMAGDAPFHLKRGDLPDQRHSIDLAVTCRTPYALVHMNAVIEIDEVRQVVNAVPLKRFAGAPALAYRLEVRACGPNLRVAVDAGLRRGDAGDCRALDGVVAVTAIEPHPTHMVLVAERNRLIPSHSGLSHVGRARDFSRDEEGSQHDEQRAEDADLRKRVGAVMKNLRHSVTCGRTPKRLDSRVIAANCRTAMGVRQDE